MNRTALAAGALLVVFAAEAKSNLTITTSSSLPPATVNVAYSQTFAASGGTPPYSWKVINGALPSGLSLDSSTGILSGTPDNAGPSQFAVRVKDSANAAASVSVSLQIQPAPLVVTTESPLPKGMVGMDYPEKLLEASGGTGDYSFSIPAAALPPGMTLDSGVLEGTPTAAGDYQLPVTVTDATGATATATLTLNIRQSDLALVLDTSFLPLQLAANAAATPPPDRVSVQSSVASMRLTYTTTENPSVPWLTVAAGGSTPDSMKIGLSNQALALAPGDYTTTVVVQCTSASCDTSTQQIAVDLTVTAPPPRLKVDTNILSFSSTPDVPIPPGQTLTIENAGSGSLGISSITCGATWCAVGAVPASIAAGAPGLITVTVDPTGMSPGYYRATLTVVSAVRTASIPVTLLISRGALSLTPAGVQFRMIAGAAPGNPSGSIGLSAAGVSPVAWTATVVDGATWLQVGSTSGTVVPGTPVEIPFSINTAAAALLAAQSWYGTIRITGANVVNSPRDFRVVLDVVPAGSPVRPEPSPSGLVFVATAGVSTQSQMIQLFAGSKGAVAWSASAATANGGSWLSVSPVSGQSSAAAPGSTTATVNASGLAPGVYRGGVTFAYATAAVRTTNVTLIVPTPAATGAEKPAPRAASACTPSMLAPTQTGLVDNFAEPAAWPTPVSIRLFDDCGNPVTDGQIVLTFSNGDPPLAMPLTDPANAIYSATWVPSRTMARVSVTAFASATGFPTAQTEVSGTVLPNAAPSINAGAVLHVFNPEVGDPLAPGTIVQIYGANLAGQILGASAIPLPLSMANVSVIIGGIEAPLYFVSSGQINAQVPFELDQNGQFDVVISANGALTTPQQIQLVPTTPGLCVYADGSVIAQHQDGTLITAASPAIPGEIATMYLAGMGLTSVSVASGSASPGSPLAQTLTMPTLVLGGNSVTPAFSGLTPTLVGLYQIDFQVPMNTTGTLELDVSQNGFGGNSTVFRVAQ